MFKKMEDDERHIINPSPDWTAFKVHLQKTELGEDSNTKYADTLECTQVLQKSRTWLKEQIKAMDGFYPALSDVAPSSNPKKSQRDGSIYTGAGGNAYMHWRLSCFYQVEGDKDRSCDHLMKALEAINTALLIPNISGVAFYCGMSGLHALAAVLYKDYKEPLKVSYHLEQLLSQLQNALLPETPDEVLYGRAGYLFCLLFVKKHLSKDVLDKMNLEQAMMAVFTRILESGKQQCHSKKCLRYLFYGTDYLGAAHGTAGILYILLQFPEWCKEPETNSWIQGTLSRLLSLQRHGNFPVTEDHVQGHVHWCHGAPGFTALLYRAYEVFKDVKYLKGMELALDCVWKYGILKKGFGVCHGTSGNAYCFLGLYRATGQDEYYYKAVKMAECVFNEEIKITINNYRDPQRYCVGVADTPYSLMEGLAGTVCFFCDLLHPERAAFPGYDGDV